VAYQFLAEVRPFAFNFAPLYWALCDGQSLPIAQNTALFSLISDTYGGNGTTLFALPNLQQRAALGAGQGNGLSNYALGQVQGSSQVSVTQDQMPAHSHTFHARSPTAADQVKGTPNSAVQLGRVVYNSQLSSGYSSALQQPTTLSSYALAVTGSSFPHNNMQPVLGINFCIATTGVYPSHG
jgi:microcystin-dependent protein